MQNELPVLWDHAINYKIFDASGNCWIDFSSGIFVANVGHGNPHIQKTLLNYLKKPLLHDYYFPSEIRSKLVTILKKLLPFLKHQLPPIICLSKIIKYSHPNKHFI